jgi:hypothetical protein
MCKIRFPTPMWADLAEGSNFGYQNRFRQHITKESVPGRWLALKQKHELLQKLLALDSEPGDLKQEPEPTATLPALGGAAYGLIGVARLAKARQQGDSNPSCLVSPKATIATSLSTSNAAPSATYARRHGAAARVAARGGKSGVSRFVAQGRGDQHRQGGTLAGKAAGKPFVYVFVGVARQGPSADTGRPATGNLPRPGAQAGRLGGPAAWGLVPALSNGVIFRAPHLTGSGRLWMARKRLLPLLPRQTQLTESVGCWTRRVPSWRRRGH